MDISVLKLYIISVLLQILFIILKLNITSGLLWILLSVLIYWWFKKDVSY